LKSPKQCGGSPACECDDAPAEVKAEARAIVKDYSPFSPGRPVRPELFVGREDRIREVLSYVSRVAKGNQENIFLAGERGIGKSSLAAYVRDLVTRSRGFLGVQVLLGGVTSLEEFVRRVFEEIVKEAGGRPWFDRIKGLFGGYIRQVGLFGISVSFEPRKADLPGLVRQFPRALHNLIERTPDEVEGLFIALDDINGLCRMAEFADWYKSFVDYVATHYGSFPVLMMPMGLPEVRAMLSRQQPSLMRIFRPLEVGRLSDDEVQSFFTRAFGTVEVTVEEPAMRRMVGPSGGLPILMHEIGDAVFYADRDGNIDEKDALRGVLDAAERIGKKYLDPKVYDAIRSRRYRSILRKLGQLGLPSVFTRREIETSLDSSEKRVFNNFLRKMRELGIIVPCKEEGRGVYRFSNHLYQIYVWMESRRFGDAAEKADRIRGRR